MIVGFTPIKTAAERELLQNSAAIQTVAPRRAERDFLLNNIYAYDDMT
jgi:hypothetical protein